jgi:hypothetical protein
MGNGSRPHRPGSKDPGQYAPKLPSAGIPVPGIEKPPTLPCGGQDAFKHTPAPKLPCAGERMK